MSNDAERKARLAQALRDNLRRRKTQARAMQAVEVGESAAAPRRESGE